MFKKPNKKHKDEILHFAYFVALVQPLMVLPQVYQIFSTQSASDISLITWVMLTLFNVSNFVYSWAFSIKPMIINNIIWIVVDLLIIAGVIAYG